MKRNHFVISRELHEVVEPIARQRIVRARACHHRDAPPGARHFHLMLCGRCPISGELAEPWVADAECPELEAHFAHMVCACSMCVRADDATLELGRDAERDINFNDGND